MAKGQAMHMYRRRPREDDAAQQVRDDILGLETIRGRCFLVAQQALVFGGDARTARDSRPAVIVKSDGQRALVVPGTSSRPTDCFLLSRGHCPRPQASQARGLDHQTYLVPIIEIIPRTALGWWLCDLNDLTRDQFLDWLRARIQSGLPAVFSASSRGGCHNGY